jgi:hypothetical protein
MYVHGDILNVAASKALRAHHALGKLAVCRSEAEFVKTATEFLVHARAVCQSLARLRETSGAHGSRVHDWLAGQITTLQQHPLEVALTRPTTPAVYTQRVARGSEPPPFEGVVHAAITPKPVDEFYFEGLDKRPAVELCASYLERVMMVLDETRSQLAELE